MSRNRWLVVLVGCLAVPATVLADGIDLPILIGGGIAIFLPLLLFNATVEAPILAKVSEIRYSGLWWPWFKANVWSLLAGIPALIINGALKEWLVPHELGARVQVYPLFLVLAIGVYCAVTVLVEWAYARRLFRKEELSVAPGRLFKAVVLANVASYLVLGPIFYWREFPRTEISEFTHDTRWAREPELTVLAVADNGNLEAASVDGSGRRVVVPHEVRDYVVSADLSQVLYRGADDRIFWYQGGTNTAIPEFGFWCRAPEMDFSPDGRYAAFLGVGADAAPVLLYDRMNNSLRKVPHFGTGYDQRLAWSSRADTFYLRAETNRWKITVGDEISYTRYTEPPDDFADHFGRIGTTMNRDGFFYTHHEAGERKLHAFWGWGSRLTIYGDVETLRVTDPAGGLWVGQAVFLGGGEEVVFELGNHVYLLDVTARRAGPVMLGNKFIVLDGSFSKKAGL